MASSIRIGANFFFSFLINPCFWFSLWDFRLVLGETSILHPDDGLKCPQVPQHHQAVLPESRRGGADV